MVWPIILNAISVFNLDIFLVAFHAVVNFTNFLKQRVVKFFLLYKQRKLIKIFFKLNIKRILWSGIRTNLIQRYKYKFFAGFGKRSKQKVFKVSAFFAVIPKAQDIFKSFMLCGMFAFTLAIS